MSLYLLSTPIGNLGDVSERFLQTVSSLKVILAEDTRVAAKLLQLLQARYAGYQLWPKELWRADRQAERQVSGAVLQRLAAGEALGFLSDAGTPGVADPGAYVVHAVRKASLPVEIIPGPSALTAALALSGFTSDCDLFLGFWPKKSQAIFKMLESLKGVKSVNLIFFESPFRVRQTVAKLLEKYPTGKLFIGRELTKKFQELLWSDKPGFSANNLKEKGEFTLVLNLSSRA